MGDPILIVEDDDDLRKLMCEWLEAVFPGCDVIATPHDGCSNPETEEQSPRVILVDVDTAEARGVDVVGRLSAFAPEAAIIALTMDDHDALREDVSAAGAVACMRKADMSDRLLPMLRAFLGSGQCPAVGSQRTMTVVCIEDELEMIKLIELTLERGPFRVMGAVSGQQGLNVARRVQPDVVLLDLMMPDMDGWEVAHHMRADERLKDVPIIALSVVHPSSYPARELPVDDYVTKPFRADELVRRVSQVARVLA